MRDSSDGSVSIHQRVYDSQLFRTIISFLNTFNVASIQVNPIILLHGWRRERDQDLRLLDTRTHAFQSTQIGTLPTFILSADPCSLSKFVAALLLHFNR